MLLRLFLNLAELQLPTHDSQLTSHNSQKKYGIQEITGKHWKERWSLEG